MNFYSCRKIFFFVFQWLLIIEAGVQQKKNNFGIKWKQKHLFDKRENGIKENENIRKCHVLF